MTAETLFSIRLDGEIRVGELADLAGTAPLTRTPHLGNQYPADLALLSMGVPMRQLDKNYSIVDKIFTPEARICDGTPVTLSQQQGVLSPYLATSGGQAAVYEHFRTIKQAVPGAVVSTYSLDYLRHIDLVEAVLDIMAEVAPESFNRVSLADGRVARQFAVDSSFAYYGDPRGERFKIDRRQLARRCIGYFEQAATSLREGTPMRTGGHVLIKAEADILLQGVIDAAGALGERRQRIYQCCGVTMARYAADPRRDMAARITHWYREVKRRSGGLIGTFPRIEMILIPTSMLRMVYLNLDRYLLHQRILSTDERLLALKHRKGADIKEAKTKRQRQRIIDRYQALFQQVRDERQALIEKQTSGRFPPFYVLGESNRFTQYDLAASGKRITIPDELLDLPVKSLAPRMKKLLAAYPRLRQAIFG